VVALAGCGGSDGAAQSTGPAAAPSAAALTDLGSVLDLRAAFNDDGGAPRLILLLSPT
jgi:hypothetical protein